MVRSIQQKLLFEILEIPHTQWHTNYIPVVQTSNQGSI